MTGKRILLVITVLSIVCILIFGWTQYNEGGPVPYPKNLGSFLVIESSPINPETLLKEIRSGNKLMVRQIDSGWPEDPPFIMSIGWSQKDYLEIAQAFHLAIWKDDPNEWHLYRALFNTSCENTSGKFESADLYYYQDIRDDGKRRYSVRTFSIRPQYGYIAWGWDTTYPRPFIRGWKEINFENITRTPAEKALELANQQGGRSFRNKENNICSISVSNYPWAFERNDWSVHYFGDATNLEVWIQTE